YPLVVRPSNVLGGRAMEIVHAQVDLERYMGEATESAKRFPERMPILLDRFLNDAIEVDVDAVCDGHDVLIGGIMEHIEQAGIHSGDSACSLPPFSLSAALQDDLRAQMRRMALELRVIGLMNAQFAIKGDDIYVLEVNPRASRTVPFVSKATGRSLAKIAARCMVGKTLKTQGVTSEVIPAYYSVKEAVFPFIKFTGVDTLLGPEMKSTGEVMGVGRSFGEAFAKSQQAAGASLPHGGRVFLSVRDSDKLQVVDVARSLIAQHFEILATRGTAEVLGQAGIPHARVNKVTEGRPHIADMIKNDEINLIVNTAESRQAIADSYEIRRAALQHKVSYTTTLAGAKAVCLALQQRGADGGVGEVYRLQDLHKELRA
ncbi:MAG: carbamoyl phosphate synthase large subunit, partial [Gammaproteobacteria bacterium]|nr:carbamoyl phosphate synthase large subunit [Gammaproteobacteria bacterium]